MKPEYYRIMGWASLFLPALLALYWASNETGLTGWLLRNSEKLLGTQLVQISWVITFAALCYPGYVAKRYFDELAWQEHVRSMPAPDPHQSARRSKYVVADTPPAPPQPVDVQKARETGKDFIATCPACGHLFPVAAGTQNVTCPMCSETLS